MDDNVKPCPFCGSSNISGKIYDPFDGYQGHFIIHQIRCGNCGAQVERKDILEAVEAWNRRCECDV